MYIDMYVGEVCLPTYLPTYLIRSSESGIQEVVVGHQHQVSLQGVLSHEVVRTYLRR